jgi:hypothetical protein
MTSKEETVYKFIWQIFIVIFLAGGGWVTLNNVEADVQENKELIDKQEKRDDGVDKKLERIETTQKHITTELDKQDAKLDAILEELRKK